MMDNQILETKLKNKEVILPKRVRLRRKQSSNATSNSPYHNPNRSSTSQDQEIGQQLINDRLPTSLIDSFFSNSLFYETTVRANVEENLLNNESHYVSETDSETSLGDHDSEEMSNLSDLEDTDDNSTGDCIWSEIDEEKKLVLFGQQHQAEEFFPTPTMIPGISPLDCYLLFLTDEVWQLMVTETNLHAYQYFSATINFDRSRIWTATNVDEMKTFIGIMLCMSLVSYPCLKNFWLEDNHIFGIPLIKSSMKYERFILLSKFLQFSNLEKFLELMSHKFESILSPGKDLILQQTVIPWRDKKFQKQLYSKSKNDVMFYKLSTRDGYTLKNVIRDNNNNLGNNQFIITKLLQSYLNQQRVIYMDKTLANVPLAEQLLIHKTMICANLHRNKVKTVIQTKTEQKKITGMECQHNVNVIQWCNEFSSMTILTTVPEHRNEFLNATSLSDKPKAVLDYLMTKKSIDLVQPLHYPSGKNGLKWHRRIVFQLLIDTVVINAWLLNNFINKDDKCCTIVQFREQLVRSLLGAENIEINKEKKHMLMCKIGLQDFNKDRKRCKGCYKKHAATMSARDAANATKKVRTFCNECNKYYCLPCFNDAHAKM